MQGEYESCEALDAACSDDYAGPVPVPEPLPEDCDDPCCPTEVMAMTVKHTLLAIVPCLLLASCKDNTQKTDFSGAKKLAPENNVESGKAGEKALAEQEPSEKPMKEKEKADTTEDESYPLVLRGTIEDIGIASGSPDPKRKWAVVLKNVKVVKNTAGVNTDDWNISKGFSFLIHSPAKTFMYGGKTKDIVGSKVEVGFHLPFEGASKYVPDEHGGISLMSD